MIEIVRRTQRNVKGWSSGEMALRWTAPACSKPSSSFVASTGYHDLARLAIAIERVTHRRHTDAAHTPTHEAAIVAAV
jgi:hypothetical protein